MSYLKKYWILLFLLAIAFFLRTVDINNNPKALYGDELTIAYDSYSLLTTGHDSTGVFLPLTLKTGAGRPGGYVYGSIPFIALFGPSALGVRSLSILSGVGIVLLMFLLGKVLFNERVGLLAAGLTVFSPWDISLSRGGFEAHFALFLALLGTVVMLSGSTKKHWIVAAIAFGLTLHTYPTYKLVLPLFLLVLYWFRRFEPKEFLSKRVLSAAGIFIILIVLAVAQTFTGGSEERFLSLNVFSDHDTNEKITQSINYERNSDHSPAAISAITHNRPVVYAAILFNSYLENFSPDFFFVSGDKNPVHNPATTGALFYCQIVLLFFGAVYLVKENQKRKLAFLVFWILIGPTSTAFLLQTHELRSAFMLPPLLIISSLGGIYLWQLKKQLEFKLIYWAVIVFFIGQFLFFAQELYFVSGQKFSDFWAYPAKVASTMANQQASNYQFIFISSTIDSIEYGYPVYSKIPQNQVAIKDIVEINNVNFEKYGNVYIGEIPDTQIEQFLHSINGSYLYYGPSRQKSILPQSQTVDKNGIVQLVTEHSN